MKPPRSFAVTFATSNTLIFNVTEWFGSTRRLIQTHIIGTRDPYCFIRLILSRLVQCRDLSLSFVLSLFYTPDEPGWARPNLSTSFVGQWFFFCIIFFVKSLVVIIFLVWRFTIATGSSNLVLTNCLSSSAKHITTTYKKCYEFCGK